MRDSVRVLYLVTHLLTADHQADILRPEGVGVARDMRHELLLFLHPLTSKTL